jgi:hypothetical protein
MLVTNSEKMAAFEEYIVKIKDIVDSIEKDPRLEETGASLISAHLNMGIMTAKAKIANIQSIY